MNSFILIDKPLGISSFDVIRQLRKKLQIRKMWHTGTLDPLATGCLLVATWNYTKLIPFLEKDTKEYEFTVCFNGTTDSYDLWTEVLPCEKDIFVKVEKNISQEKIQTILDTHFIWEIEQVPPKYSALKIWGKKAVDLVREGKQVEMKTRKATIFSIEILDFSFPYLTLRSKVSAGTYVRSIAMDLWAHIWTWAYVTKLRRTKIGRLGIESAQNLDVTEMSFLDIATVFPNTSFLDLSKETIIKLDHGLQVPYQGVEKWYYFLWDTRVTNVLFYDWANLIPKKKIL